MTTAYTSLLGLALPVTGELQGTWGDTVNNSITSLLDTAVAGTTTISTDGDVTLSTTTGSANQARQAILLCSGARTALRTLTAPAQSKIYTVINATTGGYSVKVVGVGPTTGVTVPAGQSAQIAWNGTDFVLVSTMTSSGIVPVASGGTGLSSYTTGDLIYASGSTTLSKLGIGTSTYVMTSSGTAPQWSAPAALTKTDDTNVTLTLGGSASTALLNAASLTLGWTGQLAVGRGGTGLASYTAGDLVYASGTTTISKLAIGTSNQILTSSGTAPQWTSASSISIGTATNLAGGATGSLPYQSSAGTTTFLAAGTNGYILTLAGGVPTWAANTGISTGKSIAMAMIFGG